MLLLPMYAGLPVEDQMRVFDATPKGKRKVIVSTNIAETSVTIPNIAFVIDAGFVKVCLFLLAAFLKTLANRQDFSNGGLIAQRALMRL